MATVSPTKSDIFKAFRAFVLSLVSCEVVQGLGNGVPPPVGGYIAITPLFTTRLATNTHGYNDPVTTTGSRDTKQPLQYAVQVDCYGPDSSGWAVMISTMFRDEYALDLLGPSIVPLHCDDPKMIAFVDPAESVQVERWMITANIQVNPVVSIAQQFFDKANVAGVNSAEIQIP